MLSALWRLMALLVLFTAYSRAQNAPAQFPEPDRSKTFKGLGMYAGEIILNSGQHLLVEISLYGLREQVPASFDSTSTTEQRIVGSFMVGGEGGPYSFSDVRFDIVSNHLLMKYSRSGSDLPTLWMEGELKDHETFAGVVVSGTKGKLGEFSVKFASNQSGFSPKAFTHGTWKGTWTYPNGSTAPFSLALEDSGRSVANPDGWELGYSPGRIGSARIGNFELPFTRIQIDYFAKQVIMTYQDTSSGTSLSLIGTINEKEVQGHGASSLRSTAGSFKAARVAP